MEGPDTFARERVRPLLRWYVCHMVAIEREMNNPYAKLIFFIFAEFSTETDVNRVWDAGAG